MSTYRIGRKEAIKDAINRGAVFVLVIAAIATGATSHQKKAFTMLYIFGSISVALAAIAFLHALFLVLKGPETSMRKALLKLPFELILLAFLILSTYYAFSTNGKSGMDGFIDPDVSARRVACGFLCMVAAGAQIIHAPAAIKSLLAAKYAEQDLREKQELEAGARVV
ncbi:hypothetical protein NQ176_g9969 [Zarea fungicola]|uniref:Uncharacterized protein n=1 Tax=Zarea fungicola TaxID=93591 RepID=A0ACC1MIH6_9HYPO|nr:hypothetical protein NQ176_g9969 [Lecanicillium fungicola]